MIGVVAGRELRSLYASPVAWVWLAVAIGLTAWMVLAQLESFQRIAPRLALVDGAPGLTDLVVLPGLDAAGLVGLLLAPLVGMRLFSEEQRAGRFALLLSAPVSLRQLVLGKFAGLHGRATQFLQLELGQIPSGSAFGEFPVEHAETLKFAVQVRPQGEATSYAADLSQEFFTR